MAQKNVFALLIGIDNYKSGALNGCVNDSLAVADYLNTTIAKGSLQLQTLHNEAATKKNIIDGFNKHLAQAKQNDIVFVHYSGHGSYEDTNEFFWGIDPDRRSEVMVTIDSLSANNMLHNPLADKELRWLISNIAKNNPHIAVILDCCHSGTGTRQAPKNNKYLKSRFSPAETQLRSLERYAFYDPNRSPDQNLALIQQPSANHILLAGCRNDQTAKEDNVDGKVRGLFTYSLLQTLKDTRGNLSYADLMKRTSALVMNRADEQNPQIEALGGFNANQVFLSDACKSATKYYTVSYSKLYKSWVIDAGEVHGIAKPTATNNTTTLAIYNPTEELITTQSRAIGEANVTEVKPNISKVSLNNLPNADTEKSYKAIITKNSAPKLSVRIEAENSKNADQKAIVEKLKTALAQSKTVQVAARTNQPVKYIVTAYEHEGVKKIRINKSAEIRPIAEQLQGFNDQNVQTTINYLETVEKWERLYNLTNPSSQLSALVTWQITDENDKPLVAEGSIYDFVYTADMVANKQSPAFKVKITNNSNQKLYIAVLGLSGQYGIEVSYFLPAGLLHLEPNTSGYINEGKPLNVSVGKALREAGINEAKDTIKLIASTEEFDPQLWQQEALKPAKTNREFGKDEEDEPEQSSDWCTDLMQLRTTYPLIYSPNILQTAGIKIDIPREAGKNKAGLASVNEAKRSLNNQSENIIPPAFLGLNPDEATVQPLTLMTTRGISGDLSVLELEIEKPSAITPKNPIKIELPVALKPNEYIISATSDGEFFYPIGGASQKNQSGSKTILNIQYLPNKGTQNAQKRGLLNTFKLVFQKVVVQKISDLTGINLGAKFTAPYLRLITPDGKYDSPQNTKTQLKNAQKIALVIHGFTGETKDMLFAKSKENVQNLHKTLQQHYDTIVAYDYESYNTTIEQTARDLKLRLAEAGITAESNKEIHIICHSMGGLVSRWFLEKEAGNEIVSKLIMLGTPNAGSPWPKIKDWAFTAATILLNKIPVVGWPLTAITFLTDKLNLVGDLDVTSPQMQPTSDFLQLLNSTEDVGIPYYIITGNTSLIKIQQKDTDHKIKRLIENVLQKIGIDNPAHYAALTQFLFKEANDIAVGVSSMKNMGTARMPEVLQAACDHISYFSTQAGIQALLSVLNKEETV